MTHPLAIPHFLCNHSIAVTSIDASHNHISVSPNRGNCWKRTLLFFILRVLSHAFIQKPQVNAHFEVDTSISKFEQIRKGQHNFDVNGHTRESSGARYEELAGTFHLLSRGWDHSIEASYRRDSLAWTTSNKFPVSNTRSISERVVSPTVVET